MLVPKFYSFKISFYHLEKPLNESATESERKAKIYYQSCMDPNKTIEKIGADPLLELLQDMGGWSIRWVFTLDYEFTNV